jgi:hypothetical protein
MVSVLRTWAVALLLGSTACAGGGTGGSDPPGAIRGDSMRLEELPPQTLEAGQCMAFAWTQLAERRTLVLAALDDPAEVRIQIDGRMRTLARTGFSGEARGGHFENQTYSDDRHSLTLRLVFDTERTVPDGIVLERGSIRLRHQSGWEALIPIGGMIGCQP